MLKTKGDIADFIEKTDFDGKLKKLNKSNPSNKSKHLLAENELKNLQEKTEKIQTFDSSLFIDQSYFFNDEVQLYLIFQTLYYTLKRLGDTEKIVSWKSKGLISRKYFRPFFSQ